MASWLARNWFIQDLKLNLVGKLIVVRLTKNLKVALDNFQKKTFNIMKIVLCAPKILSKNLKLGRLGMLTLITLYKNSICDKLQWIPYDNFQNFEHIADGGHVSMYSTKSEME
ncbi:hypothetical protein Glove_84g97 [Diversispora epigaea]|uniref:Uncharacterized protein n=1 Tax=Diversispora epigaea TaxID=1348612 RepID=A0A397JE68_9GLOM|nr:hypothetical protein Glove_84g97 [Diversispora epigaea]